MLLYAPICHVGAFTVLRLDLVLWTAQRNFINYS